MLVRVHASRRRAYQSVDNDSVSEPERSRAILRLRDRYATDALDLDGFSGALDGVLTARTVEELHSASPEAETQTALAPARWRDAEILQSHLSPEEAILWIGRPEPGVNLRGGRLVGSVAVLVLVIVWGIGAASSGAPAPFAIWAVIVALIIGYQAFGRTVMTARRRDRILYAVTTKRVVRVVTDRSGEQMDAAIIRTIPGISASATGRGRGTIVFNGTAGAPTRYTKPAMNFTSRNQPPAPISFDNIPDARGVARLIASLQAHDAR